MSKEELAKCELDTPQNGMAEKQQMTEMPDGYSLRQRGPQIGWALFQADYCSTISECLEQAKHLIVIADSKENLLSGWVKYEWESFFNEKLSGRKTGNIVVVLAASMRPEQLPYQLRQVQAVPLGELDKIREYLR